MNIQKRLPSVTVQPIILEILRNGMLKSLPIHVQYQLEPGMLFCFETWGEELMIDPESYVYAVVASIAPYNDALTQHDYETQRLVKFNVFNRLSDIVIL